MLHREVAARKKDVPDGHLGWVAVYPAPDEARFRVLSFEVAVEFLDRGYDLHPGDLINSSTEYVADVSQIGEAVLRHGGDPGELTAPWNVDYPL
jgi:hypothetical protein